MTKKLIKKFNWIKKNSIKKKIYEFLKKVDKFTQRECHDVGQGAAQVEGKVELGCCDHEEPGGYTLSEGLCDPLLEPEQREEDQGTQHCTNCGGGLVNWNFEVSWGLPM